METHEDACRVSAGAHQLRTSIRLPVSLINALDLLVETRRDGRGHHTWNRSALIELLLSSAIKDMQ